MNPNAVGRPKGVPNKKSSLVRSIIENAIGMSIPEKLLELARQMPKQDQVDIYKSLMAYAYPKLAAIAIQADVEVHANQEQLDKLVDWVANLEKLE